MNDVYEHVRQSSQQVSEKMKTRYDRKLNNLGFDEGSLFDFALLEDPTTKITKLELRDLHSCFCSHQ
ncbi:Transposon Ty3-I Gag-Pol polyprotein [Operophtera brumata]|uniref:Transposon Ty3-I Gag-Pol polyprotein n=1 Tax=Operophtera brumata TaxID=104452 RepID=A0A0L7LCP1_OPEBR|nr:Transposon Ty3-I Gag-Pol polyprotein [Operophtera brumata]